MSVASHLGINLDEYDARIRTFIPSYDVMLDAAANALTGRERTIVDLGVGTGALSARCLARAPRARIVGIDLDEGMLAAAAARLGPRATLVAGSFMRGALPPCDAIVASLALHHVRTRPAKARLYAALAAVLRPGGRLVVADCCPAGDARIAGVQRERWRAHLEETYTRRDTTKYFTAWAREDEYVPLPVELLLMERAGLRPDVIWRQQAFAVISAAPGS